MQIFKSAKLITLFSILARILGFIRDSLIAKFSGVSFMSDVFFAAFKIANFFRKILAEGSFFAAFVPTFTEIANKNGKVALSCFASNVFSLMLYLVIFITIICEIFTEPIIALTSPGFLNDDVKFFLTVELSKILFIYFILIVCCSILCGVLNSIKKFSYYAVVPVFLNIALILFIYFGKNYFPTFSHTLTFGVLTGGLLQFIFAYFGCVIEGLKIRIILPHKLMITEKVKFTFKKMLPSMAAGGLTQINTLLDLILGSYIVAGVSYLYYVDRIFYLPTSAIGTAISIVVLPLLSSAIHNKSNNEIKEIQTQSLNISSLLVLPASISLILFSDVLVSILFERGNFTKENTLIVGKSLSILGFALPCVVYSKTLTAIFFANSNTKTPLLIALFCAFVNVICSLTLLQIFGIYGIVLGSMISYILETVVTFFKLKKSQLVILNYKSIVIFNLKVFVSAFVAVFVCFYILVINSVTNYYQNIAQYSIIFKFFYISGVIAIGMILYYIILLIFGINAKKVLQ
jgi:putative peptidoglycan lipid II flippase